MPTDLTYPGLRCILEYLELNKRLHISARSPALRQIDKSIPVHIDDLSFYHTGFFINKIFYTLLEGVERVKSSDTRYKWPDEDLSPGEIFTTFNGLWEHKYVEIHFDGYRKMLKNRAPDGLKSKQVEKRMAELLLGYDTIYLDSLHIYPYKTLRFPKGFKVSPRILIVGGNDFHPFLPIIDPSCAPLKKIGINLLDTTNLQHPLVTTADNLVIHSTNELSNPPNFEKISNKHVELHEKMRDDQVLNLAEIWRDNDRDVGTAFTFSNPYRNMAELPKAVKVFVEGSPKACPCISIPMNSTSEINMYELKLDKLRMEVMPIGSAYLLPAQPGIPKSEIYIWSFCFTFWVLLVAIYSLYALSIFVF